MKRYPPPIPWHLSIKVALYEMYLCLVLVPIMIFEGSALHMVYLFYKTKYIDMTFLVYVLVAGIFCTIGLGFIIRWEREMKKLNRLISLWDA